MFNLELNSSRLFHVSSMGRSGARSALWHCRGLGTLLLTGRGLLNRPVESCVTSGLECLEFGYQFFSIFIKAGNRLTGNALFRFDQFEIDPAARSLRREGVLIPLNSRTFDLLLFLAEHPHQVVSKDELLAAVWPGAFVEESNLTQHIFLLRKALAGSGSLGRAVITVPGKGYQLAAAVEQVQTDQPGESAGGLVMRAVESVTRMVVEEEVDDPARNIALEGGRSALFLPTPRTAKQRWRAVAVAASVIVLIGAGWFGWNLLQPKPRDHAQVVIADFDNSTGDPTFDHTLNRVVQIDLQQSPFFSVVGESRVRQALTLMGRKSDGPITADDIREVCQRLNSQVYLTPSIAMLGSRYLVTISANSCADGSNVGARKEDADSKSGVLRAVEDLTSRIRRDVGESRASLKQFDRPLYLERTSSLDALKAYSEAVRQFGAGKMDEAVRLYQRAIELDPNFATAYADLSSSYFNKGDSTHDKENISKAYSLRDTVNERERIYITYRYHQSVTGDVPAMRDALEVWSSTYPRDNLVLADMANLLTWTGQFKESADAAVRSLELNAALGIPLNGISLEIAARAFKHLGQYDKALEYYNTAMQHNVDSGGMHGIALQIAGLRHDEKEVEHQIALCRGTADENRVLQQAAMAALADGKASRSDSLFNEALSAARRDHAEADLAAIDAYRPRILIDMGLTERARALIKSFAAEDPAMDELVAVAETGDPAQARAVAMRRQKESPLDTLVNVEYAPAVYAALAVRAGKPAGAVELLRPAEAYELRDPTIAYQRGQAFLAAKMAPEAVAEFRKLIDNPGIDDPLTPLHALAHLNLARALVLEGKLTDARAEYDQFLTAWSAADPDLPPLKQARAEMARLFAHP